jgi:hypothetical protein
VMLNIWLIGVLGGHGSSFLLLSISGIHKWM